MKQSDKKIISSITVNNKKYQYLLKKIDKNTTYVDCKPANISQPFDNSDLAELLFHLPAYIIESQAEKKKKPMEIIRFRVLKTEKKKIQKNAIRKGFKNVSSFLRDLALR